MLTKLHSKTLGTGEDIVMLPGWAMHSGVWQNFANQLSQFYRITLIDLPDNHSFSLEEITQQILSIAPINATWIGWSLGGLITMRIAIQHPEKVKKIILVNSSPCFIEKPNWPGIKKEVFNKFKESLKSDSHRTILHFLALQTNIKSNLRELKKTLLEKNLPKIDALISGLNLLNNLDLRPQLPNIKCPALFILGEFDILVPPSIEKFLHENITHAKIKTIPKAAHIPFISHPQIFLKTITAFL